MEIKHTITGTEPVTLTELKAFLKVDYTTDDTLLTSMITSAREKCERICNRSFVAQTINYQDIVDADYPFIKLPYPNHAAITAFTVVGVDQVEGTDYLKTGMNQFKITLLSPVSGDEMLIAYTTTSDCPSAVKEAIKKIVSNDYSGTDYKFMQDLQNFICY